MWAEGHEQVVMVSDAGSGLKAIIAIHDTTLGPSCGGTRIWPYKSEQEALWDALRLSRAMTYKAAAADLPLGGGKGVIIADSHTEKTEALVRAYGRFVDTLGGRYLTTTDVGSTGRDLEYIKQETDYVVGLPISSGGSGDTSIMTGLGVYMGMKSCAKEAWGKESLTGKTVAMQGFGKVATYTAHHLMKEDAKLVVTDVFDDALDRARDLGLPVLKPDGVCRDLAKPLHRHGLARRYIRRRLRHIRPVRPRGSAKPGDDSPAQVQGGCRRRQQPTAVRRRRRGVASSRYRVRPGLHLEQWRHHQR